MRKIPILGRRAAVPRTTLHGAGLLLLVLAASPLVRAQGSRRDDIVLNPAGHPIPGATITVCTAAATGTPCSPLAALFTDATLTVPSPNPFTTDYLGNFHFYATPGRYIVQISGSGILGTKQMNDVILPNDPSTPSFSTVTTTGAISALTLSLGGNLSVAGNASIAGSLTSNSLSFTNLNVSGNASVGGTLTAASVSGLTSPVSPNAAGGTTLGSASLPFSSLYIGGAATNNIQITGTATAARTFTLPDANSNPVQPNTLGPPLFVNGITSSGVIVTGTAIVPSLATEQVIQATNDVPSLTVRQPNTGSNTTNSVQVKDKSGRLNFYIDPSGRLINCGGVSTHHPWVDASCYGMKPDSGVTDNATPCANLAAALVDGDTVVFQADGTHYYGFGTGSANPCLFNQNYIHLKCSADTGGNGPASPNNQGPCLFKPGNVTLGAPSTPPTPTQDLTGTSSTWVEGSHTVTYTQLNPNGETQASAGTTFTIAPGTGVGCTSGCVKSVRFDPPKWQGNTYLYNVYVDNKLQCQVATDCDQLFTNTGSGFTNTAFPIQMPHSALIRGFETAAGAAPTSSTATHGQVILTLGNLDGTVITGNERLDGLTFADTNGSFIGGGGVMLINANTPKLTMDSFDSWGDVGTLTSCGAGIASGSVAGTCYGLGDNELLMPWGGTGLIIVAGRGALGNFQGNIPMLEDCEFQNNTVNILQGRRAGGLYIHGGWANIRNGQVGLFVHSSGAEINQFHQGVTPNSASCATTCLPTLGYLTVGTGNNQVYGPAYTLTAIESSATTSSLTPTVTIATTSPNVTISSGAIFGPSSTGTVVTIGNRNYAIQKVLSSTTANFESAPTSAQVTACGAGCLMNYPLAEGIVMMGAKGLLIENRVGSAGIATMISLDDFSCFNHVVSVNAFASSNQVVMTRAAAAVSCGNTFIQTGNSKASSNLAVGGQSVPLTLCKNITPITVNTNTTADQNLMSCSLDANEMLPQENLNIWLAGVYSLPAASTATVTVKLKMCFQSGCGAGTVVTLATITSAANANSGAVTNNVFNFAGSATTNGTLGDTASSGAAMEVHGIMGIDQGALTTSADSFFNDTNTAVSATFDATAAQFLQVTIAFSSATASNTATERQLLVTAN